MPSAAANYQKGYAISLPGLNAYCMKGVELEMRMEHTTAWMLSARLRLAPTLTAMFASMAYPATRSCDPTPSDEIDRELLAAVAAGRLGALAALYDRYRVVAYAIAARITGDPTAAEDVVQDAFLGVWRNAALYAETRGSVKTWLLAIVHHRAVDRVRRHRPTIELPDAEVSTSAALATPDVWREVSAHLDANTVNAALAGLSAVQREAIELAYFGGLTQQQVATRIGAPLGTVKSRIRMGLLTMRRLLEEREAISISRVRVSGFPSGVSGGGHASAGSSPLAFGTTSR